MEDRHQWAEEGAKANNGPWSSFVVGWCINERDEIGEVICTSPYICFSMQRHSVYAPICLLNVETGIGAIDKWST